jgi:hypothetical protein
MRDKNIIGILFIALILSAHAAEVPFYYEEENTGKDCKKPTLPEPSLLKKVDKLPNPFEWSDGSGKITSLEDWKCRRAEIKAEIEKYEIGTKPETAKVEASYNGGVLKVVVSDNGQSMTLTSSITTPSGSGPFPIIIGMNSGTGSLDKSLFSDFIQVPFLHDQVAKYGMNGNKDTSAPFYKMYPDLKSNGDYSAWAWGVSRIIDGLYQVKDTLKGDLSKIVVTGCSYAGKMALFSGAFDERVALTIAQESGGGGINAWRVADTIGNVEKIANTNYSWFMQYLKNNFNGKANMLPYDHHELVGMIAPRAFLALGNPDYEWLGDPAGYVSVVGAHEIWKAMGVDDRFGYDFAAGHTHCQAAKSQREAIQAYVDKFIRGKDGKQVLSGHPGNIDAKSWISEWAGYKLES